MIEPLLSDDAFLADVAAARSAKGVLHLWWLGQSGYLLKYRDAHALIDPYLSDSLTEKYAQTNKPHVRMTRRVIDPARLNFIDVVSSSHNHTDHLDPVTLQALARANPNLKMVVSRANIGEAATRSHLAPERILGIGIGETATIGPFSFKALPAAHNTVEYDAAGHCRCIGLVIGCGRFRIYHSGDTLRYAEQVQYLSGEDLDLALLPINGDKPERGVAGNLNAQGAAQLARDIDAKLAMPCHYEMFEFNTASPDEFRAACEAVGQRFQVLKAGERLTLTTTGEDA